MHKTSAPHSYLRTFHASVMSSALAVFCLVGCHPHTSDRGESYASPQVSLPEVSAAGCLDIHKVQQRLRLVDPQVHAERFTKDVHVELAPDACPGAEARLRQGNLRLRHHALKDVLADLAIGKQIKCSAKSVQVLDQEGGALTLKWLNSHSLEIRHRFQAVNFRRPRLEKNLTWNGHAVELTEIVRWESDLQDQKRPFPVSRSLLQSLDGELIPAPISARLNMLTHTQNASDLHLPIEEYTQLTQIPLRIEWHICEPYQDPATPPPEVPPER